MSVDNTIRETGVSPHVERLKSRTPNTKDQGISRVAQNTFSARAFHRLSDRPSSADCAAKFQQKSPLIQSAGSRTSTPADNKSIETGGSDTGSLRDRSDDQAWFHSPTSDSVGSCSGRARPRSIEAVLASLDLASSLEGSSESRSGRSRSAGLPVEGDVSYEESNGNLFDLKRFSSRSSQGPQDPVQMGSPPESIRGNKPREISAIVLKEILDDLAKGEDKSEEGVGAAFRDEDEIYFRTIPRDQVKVKNLSILQSLWVLLTLQQNVCVVQGGELLLEDALKGLYWRRSDVVVRFFSNRTDWLSVLKSFFGVRPSSPHLDIYMNSSYESDK